MATTWDSLFKDAGVTLSGSNLVATVTSGASEQGVGANRKITGLTYGEMTIGASLTGTERVGFYNQAIQGATVTTAGGALGATVNSIGYDQTGAVKINAATLATIAAFVATDSIDWAINPIVGKVWFRVTHLGVTGGWNNDVIANQNPNGNVGGISLATLAIGELRPAYSATFVTPNQAVTAVFATGSFVRVPPTGYVTIDTIQSGMISAARNLSTTYNTVGPMEQYGPPTYVGLTISGSVEEIGAPVAGRAVRLYEKNSGALLDATVSDGSGNFSLKAYNRKDVYATALDPTTYQAITYDELTPL